MRTSIPSIFEQLIVPRLQQLDYVLAPGCTSFTWVSPNIGDFCSQVEKSLDQFELIMNRVSDLVMYRIDAVFNDMTNIPLCVLYEEEPITIEEFLARTEDLCRRGGELLQAKSSNIEDATEELIELLYPDYKNLTDETLLGENEERESDHFKPLSASVRSVANTLNKPQLTPAQIAAKRKREAQIAMQEVAQELFSHFNHRNLDAIVKLVKTTLERLRRRILASQIANIYGEK